MGPRDKELDDIELGAVKPVVDWLVDGARSATESADVLVALCERLVAVGLPLWRVAVFVNTLHPEIVGRRFLWRADAGVSVADGGFEIVETAEYRNSPFAYVVTTGAGLRRHLADPGCPDDYSMLQGLREDGVTDYVAVPLTFTNGEVHVATWTTRRPGGFSEMQLAGLDAITAPLARVAEIRALRRTATNLLDTYVGHHAGKRILAGRIRRGHTEAIHAVIWLSDMRGFTALADRLSPSLLIGVLNRYFDCQVPAIVAEGGEVLKFMGDGLLAIFPIAGAADAVCARAVAAARQARAQVAALDGAAGMEGVSGLRFGLALHLGEVLYGNIGGGNRLDFTCIGPAVNLAARLEKLAGQLSRDIVASGTFAEHCRSPLAPLGDFALAGFATPQPVYALDTA
jgi:adenylate cyclase